jgi:hypothetical protein
MADADELGRRLAAVAVSDSDSANNNLFQVMRAVEDAEATIRQQVSYPITISFFIFLPPPPPPHSLSLSLSQLEENSRLKDELMLKTRELDRFVSGSPICPFPLRLFFSTRISPYNNMEYIRIAQLTN